MFSQRIAQQSLRRLAAHPSSLSRPSLLRLTAPAAFATSNHVQSRQAATTSEGQTILEKQRLLRPISPHLTIYQPQMTWYPSMLNRITGTALSGGLYIFGAAYLVAPLMGWHLESQSMAAAFAAWPVIAKVAVKMTCALPFTFHSFNGVRHLIWDFGLGITNSQVVTTGWIVIGLSTVSAGLLAIM